jgi:antitoxin FitA
MPQLTIRGLTQEAVDKLKARAQRNGRSLEAELRLILEQAANDGT